MKKLLLTVGIFAGLQASTVYEQLVPFKSYLEWGTYEGQDWSSFIVRPKSRFDTFLIVFEHLASLNHRPVVVELGTSRSYVHGGEKGCNEDNPKYWYPQDPSKWDWGAGFFTRMAALSLAHLNPVIHTVDIARSHIERCKHMTKDFSANIRYHVASSVDFLKRFPAHQRIDLIYLDTGDMTPIEPTALLQLEEVKVIVERNLLAPNGLILIDDVRNQTPKKFGEKSDLGKAKYSITYLVQHGYEVIADEYQVILRKR